MLPWALRGLKSPHKSGTHLSVSTPKTPFYCLFNLVSACLSKFKLVAGEQCIFILIPMWLLVIGACTETVGCILDYVSEEKKSIWVSKICKIIWLGILIII